MHWRRLERLTPYNSNMTLTQIQNFDAINIRKSVIDRLLGLKNVNQFLFYPIGRTKTITREKRKDDGN